MDSEELREFAQWKIAKCDTDLSGCVVGWLRYTGCSALNWAHVCDERALPVAVVSVALRRIAITRLCAVHFDNTSQVPGHAGGFGSDQRCGTGHVQ